MHNHELDELKKELPSFADMIDLLDRIRGKVSGSEQYKIENIRLALLEAAKIVTVETSNEESRAIDELNNILR